MPLLMAFDAEGHLCVFDAGNARITVFSPQGSYLRSVPVQFRGLPGGFALDSTGAFYLSWYDPKSERVIHKYSPTGEPICSFGDPIRFRSSVGYREIALKQTISCGPLLVVGDALYYSQYNPYEIRQYTLDGQLRMRVFRKNRFLQPARLQPGGSHFKPPPSSLFLGLWNGKLVHQLAALPHPVIDVFDLRGNLLCSYAQRSNLGICFSDGQGTLYGLDVAQGVVTIVRAKLMFREGGDGS
jgi:hypothetical protein